MRAVRPKAVGGVRRGVDDGFSGDLWGDTGAAARRDPTTHRSTTETGKSMDETFTMCSIAKTGKSLDETLTMCSIAKTGNLWMKLLQCVL